jgi:23S rRNA pseudouridine1911/1915/1917 synthase
MLKRDALTLLFQDDAVVAVDKPAGLATIPGRGETDSVLERLARQLDLPHTGSTDPRIRVVHRLDKDTSGVLLFAKHTAAQRHLSHQFQNNAVGKEYLAIVTGRPTGDEGEIDAPLAPHPADRLRMAVAKHGGRPARTLWKVEQRLRDYALLRCFPKTGKTHQIRVHLKHIGVPLAVDPLYNRPRGPGAKPGLSLSDFKRDYRAKRGEDERPLIDRLTLHAERLGFIHPDGRTIDLLAPLPKDFRAALNMLAKYGR